MRCVILNLHGLGAPDLPLDDPAEARYWIAPQLLDTAIARCKDLSDRVEARFTFDDGNLSDLEIGAPMLRDAGYAATFFVLSERIGQPGYLSQDNIRQLIDMGHHIGTHGADHVDWTTLDAAGITREMTQARDQIAKAARTPITDAAIPFGRYNRTVLRALRAAGYRAAYSSDGGAVTGAGWPIPRTSLSADMTAGTIDNILLGHEPLKTSLRRRVARAIKARV